MSIQENIIQVVVKVKLFSLIIYRIKKSLIRNLKLFLNLHMKI